LLWTTFRHSSICLNAVPAVALGTARSSRWFLISSLLRLRLRSLRYIHVEEKSMGHVFHTTRTPVPCFVQHPVCCARNLFLFPAFARTVLERPSPRSWHGTFSRSKRLRTAQQSRCAVTAARRDPTCSTYSSLCTSCTPSGFNRIRTAPLKLGKAFCRAGTRAKRLFLTR
jgi:hypothetical protein